MIRLLGLGVMLLPLILLSGCSTRGALIVDEPVPVVRYDVVVDVPINLYPPPGLCRIWFPGDPPAYQLPPGNCEILSRKMTPGAWLLYRPPGSNRLVRLE